MFVEMYFHSVSSEDSLVSFPTSQWSVVDKWSDRTRCLLHLWGLCYDRKCQWSLDLFVSICCCLLSVYNKKLWQSCQDVKCLLLEISQ